MHPVRRRKKRPNYGVRTVEVKRGQNGFGFTISGQHPCILSCIVPGSPAETAGLRAGDYLVAVEGQSVSKVPHDDVVRLIGCTNGVLKLQIAESYYSDSSDEDIIIASRQKPKYTHKSRLHGRAAKVVRDLRTGVMFEEEEGHLTPPRNNKPDWKEVSPLVRPLLMSCLTENVLGTGYSHNYHPSLSRESDNDEVLTAVVGYVGTIEMPTKLPPQSSLQVVRGCIKRLRAEKRTHTPVLMTVLTRSLRLASGNGAILAIYPKERVTFCARAQDKDDRHFGVVTTGTGHGDPSSSCHVFALDPKHHATFSNRARIVNIDYQPDYAAGASKEFPMTSEPIVSMIKNLYENDGNNCGVVGGSGVQVAINRAGVANSPQPSHDSTTTTSNSDSGIGFRDDSGNQSDRILLVDPNNHAQLHIQLDKVGNIGEKVNFREMSASCRSRSPLSTGSEGPVFLEEMSVSSGATKSPTEDLASPYKLSPKVFPTVSQSLEDLKNQEELTRPLPGTHWGSLQDLRVLSTDCESPVHNLHEGPEGGVSSWATSFEKLLDDPLGLQTFAEFLKKEFSHENIFFWVACENYRRLEDVEERKRKAKEIFECHLDLGALEPVNVDSYARQVTEEQLDLAPADLFLQAQKQIFNLMKFDSYPRFIKSDLYKECVMRVLAGEELPVKSSSSQLHLNSTVNHTKLMKSWSDAEERGRKSLLGWAVRRGWAKSRHDRHDNYSDECGNSVSSSVSSLSTWDVTLSSGLTRVGLPDGSTAVVPARSGLTVKHLIKNLLSKRAIDMPDFNVRFSYRNKMVSLDDDASSLSGQEVTVVRKVVFRLDLPNRKTILVKSRGCNTLGHVLRPILIKYGYNIDMVTLCLMSENEVVEPSLPVTEVDNQRIQVLTRSTPTNCLSQLTGWRIDDSNKAKSLDEITNRVFEELLQGKVENNHPLLSDQGSVRSEDWGSESSSGILDRFLRCDSTFIEKQRKTKKNQNKNEESERKSTLSKLPPLIAKLKPSSKYESRSESDVLYEGLKRAQRSRLEDQRGTEINFELPDFLKDKENTPQGGKKVRKLRVENEEKNSKVYICENGHNRNGSSTAAVSNEDRKDKVVIGGGGEITVSKEKEDSNERTTVTTCQSAEPPPLPPKPKNLIPWPDDLRPRARTRRAVYLDQPSSSFV